MLGLDNSDDPLARAIKPPEDETPQQRAQRIQKEQEALRVSQEIDKELNSDRVAKKKNRSDVKILLLGPSGSGKSTTLKNFQLTFTPKALQAEALMYTFLIYLNVVTSVRRLCDALDEQEIESDSEELFQLRKTCVQLESVLNLEADLTRQFDDVNSSQLQKSHKRSQSVTRKSYEVTTFARGGWYSKNSWRRKLESGPDAQHTESREHARRVLAENRQDIEFLAQHPSIREFFAARGQQVEHLPGYFLNDLNRIIAFDYTPTDDDILRTRIRTLGVKETRFILESGLDAGQKWDIIDVGGSRSQRAAWVPYFDDVTAIIFMAPVGQFDQFLEEDPSINCLQDAFELWKWIVSNKLLSKARLILFLNKYDMLCQKLAADIKFSDFVTSYTDQPNDVESVGRYLQRKFIAAHKQHSVERSRQLHIHFTSVTDKSSTMALISQFQLEVFRGLIRDATLI
ncbi:G-alpha-domain-containing protein [Ramaria rubella]|nr:G-alpha-domain-containing protein [Ramaria rubella]